ncbi:MAG: B12-binding domain-containing radical SAM protein [Deltaproteobacteria bacterium]|nr:B12-binding domain-containing radical SAM protein [Deltaproteobacteria bacterium]
MADITLANLNMLYVRYIDRIEREIHLPLGPLYVASSLERAGFEVDFRDYQLFERARLFTDDAISDFLQGPADIVFVSCMANLLPFTLLATRRFKKEHPEVFLALGGVGAASVEREVLERCPWIDAIGIGEGERTTVELASALRQAGRRRGVDLSQVAGIAWRDGDRVVVNAPRGRIAPVDAISLPAYHHVDLKRYRGINMISSRGCPFPCTFCSVAPVWGRHPELRSAQSIVQEMTLLHERGAELILFQDEYFVSSAGRVQELCSAIRQCGLKVHWKAFGRIDLTDLATMEAMADAGCVELRYGVESGSDRVLSRVRKGFTAKQASEVMSAAVGIFPGVDAFYMWGFPFETMEDFQQTLLHMISSRTMGVRILPSLLSMLPQTQLYAELGGDRGKLEFCPEMFPEYMLTGQEVCGDGRTRIAPEYEETFSFIERNPDLFPGFFHFDVKGNVLPKHRLLSQFGFYPMEGRTELLGSEVECCGAHSP